MATDFSKILSDYFALYLREQKGYGENTLRTYRDTFVQLLEYMRLKKKKQADKITIADLDFETVNSFLDYLENEKNVSVSTRNNRLAALKSFFKYVGYRRPEYLNQVSAIREISKKKAQAEVMNYLTIPATEHFLSSFDLTKEKELRAFCIIVLLYESGARVSELCNLRLSDLRLSKPYTVIIKGKGKKIRSVPIDEKVVQVIKQYIRQFQIDDSDFLFQNSQKQPLTREGVNYLIKKYFNRARDLDKSLYPNKISAHCLRHSKAMHLLENGVNLIYIRDILGHSSVTTTEIYSKANPEIKRKHLEMASQKYDIELDYTSEQENDLLDWLRTNI